MHMEGHKIMAIAKSSRMKEEMAIQILPNV